MKYTFILLLLVLVFIISCASQEQSVVSGVDGNASSEEMQIQDTLDEAEELDELNSAFEEDLKEFDDATVE